MSKRIEEDNKDVHGASEDAPLLCGIKPVLELLERDPSRVDAVWLRKGRRSPETDRILDLCRDAKVRFYLTDGPGLDRICAEKNRAGGLAGDGQANPAASAAASGPAKQNSHPGSTSHQGVVARLFEAGFVEFSALLESGMDAPLPLIVALDQVRDPGNAGSLARTIHAMGGAGLVIPRHNGVYLGAGARRSAAGALEQLPVAKVMNLARALDEARDAGWRVYGAAAGEGSVNAFTAPLHLPALLVLGSEEKGLRPQVEKRCHELVRVPMLRPFDSLNVAQAGAVLVSCFARTLPAFLNA